MMGCVPLDADANPLRNAIIWADQRATAQVDWLAERIAPEDVYHITGHLLSVLYSLAKILWLRDHQPEIFNAIHKFVHAKEFIVARLTGQFVTDRSDASGMNLYDLERGAWSAQILDAAGLDPAQLPEIHPATDVVGEVRAAVADEVGVAAGTPVVIGGGDGACAADRGRGARAVVEPDYGGYLRDSGAAAGDPRGGHVDGCRVGGRCRRWAVSRF
jgi:xylulokinase